MAGKKPPPSEPPAPSDPAWQVILEEMRSQNRATIEAVQGTRDELKRDIAELRENTDARFQVLESAVRENSADILGLRGDVRQLQGGVRQVQGDVNQLQGDVRQLQGDVCQLQGDVRNLAVKVAENSVDIRRLDEKVDKLSGLEARVSALERQRS